MQALRKGRFLYGTASRRDLGYSWCQIASVFLPIVSVLSNTRRRLHGHIGFLIIAAAVVAIAIYICLFKLIDNDFFWHVKSGELMWKTGTLIRTEPYSYVLAGKPYGALHEWLAQIIFYLMYTAFGVTGAILMRGVFSAFAALTLMFIDRKSAMITGPIVVVALFLHRASLMVRPQLFSIFLVCVVFAVACRYLRAREERIATHGDHRTFLLSMLFLEILWVNLHGASAIFGALIAGCFFLQGFFDWHRSNASEQGAMKREFQFRSILFAAVALAMLASPNFFKTFVDMYMHRFDGTIPLVREWMPLIWHDYATDVLPFGVLAAGMIILQRRQWVFCSVLLLVTGYLSRLAYRHCIIFVLLCVGIIIFQLAVYAPWGKIRDRLLRFPIIVSLGSLLILLFLLFGMYRRDLTTVFRNNDFGFGMNIPVIGASDFVEKEGITGTLFNTYNQGGYLLYRFSPQRKVFADGRNIEYGYPFIQKILDAGGNPARWKELDRKYAFTYAIVEYKSMPEYGMSRPYIMNFEEDPSWRLVYLDDVATVYVRNLPQYADIIQKYEYKILSPNALEFTDVLDKRPPSDWGAIEKELKRVALDSPTSIKPRIILGNHYLLQHRLDEAKAIALEALQAKSYHSEIYELLGRISTENQDWAEAGMYLEKAVELNSSGGPTINYDYLAMIFSKAGENDKAEIYHRKALRAGQASPVVGEGARGE
jgi:hypothetical protein